MNERIYLSPPQLEGDEYEAVRNVLDSNWIAPVGPELDAFEHEFAIAVDSTFAVAVSSGTAALHLALIAAGVGPGDEVMVSTFTFAGSVFPIVYLGAKPVFIDSEPASWNMDPDLLAEALQERASRGTLPKAVIVVHLYGQCADMQPIETLCAHYGIVLIEDAAEALGARYRGRSPGTSGQSSIFSFNGNKIITTSGGGMLVTDQPEIAAVARKLASQAREPEVHYEHRQIGYNYRMSNLLASIGRVQLRSVDDRVLRRRRIFDTYHSAFADVPGVTFMPEPEWSYHSRWLTTLTIEPNEFGADRETMRIALEKENIESRPVWKPMHLQPVFIACETYGGRVAERLFETGLCLPSGSSMSLFDQERVIGLFNQMVRVLN